MKNFFLAILTSSFALATAAQAQDTAIPTVTLDTPVSTTLYNTNIIPITGTAKDAGTTVTPPTTTPPTTTPPTTTPAPVTTISGISRVEYKLSGGQWKELIQATPGLAETRFFGTFRLDRGKSTRLSYRAIDRAANESNTTIILVRRSKVTRKF